MRQLQEPYLLYVVLGDHMDGAYPNQPFACTSKGLAHLHHTRTVFGFRQLASCQLLVLPNDTDNTHKVNRHAYSFISDILDLTGHQGAYLFTQYITRSRQGSSSHHVLPTDPYLGRNHTGTRQVPFLTAAYV